VRHTRRSVAVTLSVLAIVIAGLSFVWTVVWSVYTHRRQTTPSVVVSVSFALPLYAGGRAGEQAIDVTATNTGSLPVTLTSVRFEIEGRDEGLVPLEWLMQSPGPLPVTLRSGEQWNALVALASITGSLRERFGATGTRRVRRRVRARIGDSAGRAYRSDGWLNLGEI
jgi:hypothetical protein